VSDSFYRTIFKFTLSGGGIHDEEIELHFLPIDEVDAFIFDESKAKTPRLMFSFYWFLKNRVT